MPLNDYIISVFCLIDDLYLKIFANSSLRKAGFAPILKDSEVITMVLIGEILGLSDNKKIWLLFKSNYLDYFPRLELVRYKIFNKQATNLWHVIEMMHQKLLQELGQWNLFLADGVPIPVCHLARHKRSTLFKDKVAKHYCAAKKEHYYGFKLLLVTTDTGIPITYSLDAANIDERKILLDTNIPANSTIIADKGFIGKELAEFLKSLANITLLTPKRRNMLQQMSSKLSATITSIRKRIETSISQLTEIFHINSTKARSYHGLIGRINRKILSYTVALMFNYQIVKDQFTQLKALVNP